MFISTFLLMGFGFCFLWKFGGEEWKERKVLIEHLTFFSFFAIVFWAIDMPPEYRPLSLLIMSLVFLAHIEGVRDGVKARALVNLLLITVGYWLSLSNGFGTTSVVLMTVGLTLSLVMAYSLISEGVKRYQENL